MAVLVVVYDGEAGGRIPDDVVFEQGVGRVIGDATRSGEHGEEEVVDVDCAAEPLVCEVEVGVSP